MKPKGKNNEFSFNLDLTNKTDEEYEALLNKVKNRNPKDMSEALKFMVQLVSSEGLITSTNKEI